METTMERMTLQQRAESAAAEFQVKRDREQGEREARERARGLDTLKRLLKQVLEANLEDAQYWFEDNDARARVDGLVWAAIEGTYPRRDRLFLVGVCPDCRCPVWHEVDSLVSLGWVLTELPKRPYDHTCPEPEEDEALDVAPVPPTPTCTREERELLDLLRRVLVVRGEE